MPREGKWNEGILEISAVAETKDCIPQRSETSRRQLLAEEPLPEQEAVMRHVTLSSGRDDEYHELISQQGGL